MDYDQPLDHVMSTGKDSLFKIPYDEDDMSSDITLVTAYFHIPGFRKNWHGTEQNKSTYMKWMTTYSKVNNNVIAYMDNTDNLDRFRNIRSTLDANLTRLVHVPRKKLWSFSLLPRVTKLFSRDSYPRFVPNTVQAVYPCTMHAKYELMLHALRTNPYKTKYFCWVDMGLYRGLADKTDQKPFKLVLPAPFNDSKVAYTEVFERKNITAKDAFLKNKTWIAGTVFLAKASVMIRVVEDYLRAVQYYLSRDLMSTDQQLLYAMYQDPEFVKHAEVQTFKGYFPKLGYMMKNAGEALERERNKQRNASE